MKFILMSLAVCLYGCCYAMDWTLCRDGKAAAVIVIAPDASETDRFAADELSRFLKQKTGAVFSVCDRPSMLPEITNIYVAAPLEAADKHGRDGIVIKNRPDGFILSGTPPRGAMYAVFTFIEDYLGFRFWSGCQCAASSGPRGKSGIPRLLDEAETLIPPLQPDLTVSIRDLEYTPPFELREPYWGTNLNDPDWCVRNKVIGRITKTGIEGSRYGRHINIIGHIQSFWYWLPPKKYFATHPEYYSLIAGVRNWKNPKGLFWADRQTQLCMTNADVAAEIAEQILLKLRKSTVRVNGVSLAPNDWNNFCQCDECRAAYQRYTSPSGALLLLVNRVAEKVHMEFPEVEIHTGAYMWYQEPPKGITPGPKVVVWFVTQGMNLCEKYTSSRNILVLKRLKEWAAICRNGKLYVWDHGANWEHYLVPFPDLYRWQETMRLYRDIGVKGVWFLGAYSTPNMEFAAMRNWVMAKLCWNPSLEVEPLIKQFLTEYYKEAAPWIERYLRNYHETYRKSGQSFDKWRWSPLSDCRFLSPELLFESNKLIARASQAVKGNPELERRVMRVQISLWYMFLLRYDELKAAARAAAVEWPFPDGMSALLAKFNAALKPAGIENFAESSRSFWPTVTERAGLPEKLSPPPGCEKLPSGSWTILTPDNFLPPAGVEFERVDDPDVPGKVALRLRPDKSEPLFRRPCWNIPLHVLARETGRKVRVLLFVKVERGKPVGRAFAGGVQHRSNRLQVNVSQVPDNSYHWYDLGEVVNPCDWTHIWFKAPNNPDGIHAVSLGGAALILGSKEKK